LNTKANPVTVLIILLIIIGTLPLLFYEVIFMRVPTLSAEEAIKSIRDSADDFILVDTRSEMDYLNKHIAGSINWSIENIVKMSNIHQVPDNLVNKSLLLISNTGVESLQAADHLKSLGVENVFNISGGLQAWILASPHPVNFVVINGQNQIQTTSFRQMNFYEQIGGIISGLIFKPIYMFISILIGVLLVLQSQRDLWVMGWSLIAFFIGEAFCALNYLLFNHNAYLPEYFHSYGMVFAFSLAIYSLIKGFDQRIINYSSPNKKCVIFPFCGVCAKFSEVACKGKTMLMYLIPALLVLCSIPLFSKPNEIAYSTSIFKTQYNYAHLVIFQYFESIYLPIISIMLFSITFFILIRSTRWPIPELIKILFAIAIGCFGFSMFRLFFNSIYKDNLVWASFWEETTELIFVLVVLGLLLNFQKRFFDQTMFGFFTE
jgi:rhodanese-related sulfurtransferase